MSKRSEKGGFEKRLLTYSITAAGTLALATGADADIVYSGPEQNIPVSQNITTGIDLDNDEQYDFEIKHSSGTLDPPAAPAIEEVVPSFTSRVYIIGNSWIGGETEVKALSAGYAISSNRDFFSSSGLLSLATYNSYYESFYYYDGQFINTTGYIGVRFDCGEQTCYGWIQYQGNLDGPGLIIDWAYEDSGNPIAAGGTPENPLPVTLSEFSATSEVTGVALHWRTESEVNNVGFNIYRATKKGGPFSKIGFIEGHGSTGGAREYRFIDGKADAGETYFYLIEDIDIEGKTERSEVISTQFEPQRVAMELPTGFRLYQKRADALLPTDFGLHQNFPNPFNPETWIPFQIPQDAPVTIHIYNLNGRVVRTLPLGRLAAGYYNERSTAAHWDGRSDMGESFPSGVYFYRLEAGAFSAVRKMVVLK
jgi:hypothetical protein